MATWDPRQFIALTAVSEVNALAFFSFIRKRDAEEDRESALSLIQFCRELAMRLVLINGFPRTMIRTGKLGLSCART